MSDRRLIEVAFPLRETSLDSVHEKNVRHGHISTLHIWPARRPLAASRAALIATLLPDPGNDAERKELLSRLAGKVVEEIDTKGNVKITTKGGILHWGRESGPDLAWFREKIREAYNGRAPRVLDPFSGGGAIPLEAMRLGCEAIAADINPVAWFILKCTLEYPQRLAGETRPLPDFAIQDDTFRAQFMKANGIKKGSAQKGKNKQDAQAAAQISLGAAVETESAPPNADLAWHVRAWGNWVLKRAKADLARFYPEYLDFVVPFSGAVREWRLLSPGDNPEAVAADLNAKLSPGSLLDPKSPRWVSRTAIAYLWARTIDCKKCGAEIPLLKTLWLKKPESRVALTIEVVEDTSAPGKKSAMIGIRTNIPASNGSNAERRATDAALGRGTMSRAGARCPCCTQDNTMEDIRLRARNGRLGARMTAVVAAGPGGKDYRLPRKEEISAVDDCMDVQEKFFADLPFGLPSESIAGADALGMRVPLYGINRWSHLFNPRQIMAAGSLLKATRAASAAMREHGYSESWLTSIYAYLAVILDRTVNYLSTVCIWDNDAQEIKQTFLRFALPITWDHAEANVLAPVDRFYAGAISNVFGTLSKLLLAALNVPAPRVMNQSAVTNVVPDVDVVVTDPPYYDAIPYSDLMDFFYVWLRRSLSGISPEFDRAFESPLAPKWNSESNDGELVEDSARFGGSADRAREAYELGMSRAFAGAAAGLSSSGRFVVVFANKQPVAWEALVGAVIRAGFVVTGSWPIVTEMRGGIRNFGRASLASSVWLVCRKRPATARPGWDNVVLEEMKSNIAGRLRQFWDDGIRGPDFVWAATGPAMEAFSKYPLVKKANAQGETMSVGEFLKHARRLVVEYVCARVLAPSGDGDGAGDIDPVTTYYLLHRSSFGAGDVPIGPCILFSVSCGLSDVELSDTWDVLQRMGAGSADDENDDDDDADDESAGTGGKGAKVRLKPWDKRVRKGLGETAPGGRPVPLIDRIHRAAQLRQAGNENDLNHYVQEHGLSRNQSFQRVLQALIELAEVGSAERAQFEALSSHVASDKRSSPQSTLFPAA